MTDIVEELTERAASYRLGGPSSEHTALLLERAATQIASLRSVENSAKAVLASWDERGMEQEQYVESSATGHSYWSPAASLVSSGAIAGLRAALK